MVTRLPRIMFAALLALLGLCAAGHADQPGPTITLRLESPEILLGDTVILEIESVGLEQPIDLDPLRDIAQIGRETYGTRIEVIGGKVVEVRLRRIEIVPRASGVVIVGPLQAGDVTSNTASVSVLTDRPADWAPGPDDLALTMTASRADPHVQEEVVLDIVLSHRYPMLAETLPKPDLSGLDVLPVFEERRTLDEKAGLRRIAWRYLVWPKHSGALSIPGVTASGDMQRSRLERGKFSVTTPPVRLAVRPSAFPAGDWWLPAQSLSLTEEWSGDVTGLNAGDELVRTIRVSARGVRAVQIPDIAMPEARALAITPLGAHRSQAVSPEGITAQAEFRFRVRALSPIPVFPDTIRLPWFNTTTGEAREAIIPARRINIGIPDREALLQQAAQGHSAAERLAQWLRLTTGPGLLAAAGLLLLALALGLGLGRTLVRLRSDWRHARQRRRLLTAARATIRRDSPAAATARLDELARLTGGEMLQGARLAAGEAAYGRNASSVDWRARAEAALAAAETDAVPGAGPNPRREVSPSALPQL